MNIELVWKRTITGAEMVQLFNGGSGISYTLPAPPTVTLVSPANDTTTIDPSIAFICNATKGADSFLENITFALDGVPNETITLPAATNDTEQTFNKILSFGEHTWSCNATGEDLLIGSSEVRTINITQINILNETFNNETTEGGTETFEIVFESSQAVSSATLYYNGTPHTGTINSGSFPNVTATTTFIVPLTSADVNVTFLWEITLADLTVLNTTSHNQTIFAIALDNCGSFTRQLFNFTMVDEKTQVFLDPIPENTSIEVDINIFSEDRSELIVNFSNDYDEINSALVCLNINITNGTIYSLDSITKYSSLGRALEYFHIQNLSLTNATASQNITLFDLNFTTSTPFKIVFKDASFLQVPNAVIEVQRQYVSEGVFKVVEAPLTSSEGDTVAHLVRDDIIYNFIIKQNNIILATFQNVIPFCDDILTENCVVNLNALSGSGAVFVYDDVSQISHSISYNETSRLISVIFSTLDGTSKNVTFNSVKADQLGNTTVCSSSLVSVSGTLSCTVPDSIGNSTIYYTLLVDGNEVFSSFFVLQDPFDLGDI